MLLYFSTAAAFVLVTVAVVFGPPPLWVPVCYVVLYLGLLVWGALDIRLRMFDDAICEVPEASDMVALTFDDGPDPVATRQVLRLLSRFGARATFFVVGKRARQFPDVLREIVNQGHSLGVHSESHQRFYALLPPERVRSDIEATRDVVFEITGIRPRWFRPPVGQTSPRTASGTAQADAPVIGWSVRCFDGRRAAKDVDCLRRLQSKLEAGAIVLLHDAWARQPLPEGAGLDACPAGVRVLEEILRQCQRRGLRPVTVEELLVAAAPSTSA